VFRHNSEELILGKVIVDKELIVVNSFIIDLPKNSRDAIDSSATNSYFKILVLEFCILIVFARIVTISFYQAIGLLLFSMQFPILTITYNSFNLRICIGSPKVLTVSYYLISILLYIKRLFPD
jgi:hypothetical protein